MVKVVGEPCSPLPLLSPIREKLFMVSPSEDDGPSRQIQYLPQSAELLVKALQRSEVQMNVLQIADDDTSLLNKKLEIGRIIWYEEGDTTIIGPPTPKMTLTTKEMDVNERMADRLLESIISMDDNDIQSASNSVINYDHDDDEGQMTHNSIANLQRDLENAVHYFNEYDSIEDDARLLHRLKRWFFSLNIIKDQKLIQAYSSYTSGNYGAMYTATIINIIGASLGIGYVFNSAVARFCARIVIVSIMMRSKRVKLG